jgi:hypothetical protein
MTAKVSVCDHWHAPSAITLKLVFAGYYRLYGRNNAP